MKTLNDFFSKIYCINLDRRPDRWEECIKEFEKLNISVERVSAIDGKDLIRPRNMGINLGAYGLVFTNINILNDAIKNNYKNVLILEDDAKFIDNFYDIFNEKILELPDNWDLLYLGGIHRMKPSGSTYDLCKTNHTITTHAVGINSKFYQILLESISQNMNSPIDKIQLRLQQKYQTAYAFIPSLVKQRASYSDIENRFRNG